MKGVKLKMKQREEIKNTMDFIMSVPSSSPSLEDVKIILWVNAGVTVLAMLSIGLIMTCIF
jgi:hypothetical protein